MYIICIMILICELLFIIQTIITKIKTDILWYNLLNIYKLHTYFTKIKLYDLHTYY